MVRTAIEASKLNIPVLSKICWVHTNSIRNIIYNNNKYVTGKIYTKIYEWLSIHYDVLWDALENMGRGVLDYRNEYEGDKI